MTPLQIVCAVIALGITAVGIALMVRAVRRILATFRLGQPENRGDRDEGAPHQYVPRAFRTAGTVRVTITRSRPSDHWST